MGRFGPFVDEADRQFFLLAEKLKKQAIEQDKARAQRDAEARAQRDAADKATAQGDGARPPEWFIRNGERDTRAAIIAAEREREERRPKPSGGAETGNNTEPNEAVQDAAADAEMKERLNKTWNPFQFEGPPVYLNKDDLMADAPAPATQPQDEAMAGVSARTAKQIAEAEEDEELNRAAEAAAIPDAIDLELMRLMSTDYYEPSGGMPIGAGDDFEAIWNEFMVPMSPGGTILPDPAATEQGAGTSAANDAEPTATTEPRDDSLSQEGSDDDEEEPAQNGGGQKSSRRQKRKKGSRPAKRRRRN